MKEQWVTLLSSVLLIGSSFPAQALELDNVCNISYVQNRIEAKESRFDSDSLIATEREELWLDQRKIGFEESYDQSVVEKLKSKGYTLMNTTGGEVMLRKFEVQLKGDTFKKYLWISFALRTPLPGIKNFVGTPPLNILEQVSQKKQANLVATFLDHVPHCNDLKKAAAKALAQKKEAEEKAKNGKDAEILALKESLGDYEGLDQIFQELKTAATDSQFLGSWKAFAKAHLNEETNESTFSSLGEFDGFANFHLRQQHVEKNKVSLDLGCPGNYVDLEFKDDEMVFTYWPCGGSWLYNHCKYFESQDSMICNQRDEKANHSYIIYRRFDPNK